MQAHRFAAVAISLAVLTPLTGCIFGHKHAVQIEKSDVPVSSRWNGTLATPPNLAGALQIRGTAWMASVGASQTRVYVSIANAAPGGNHPWHVHIGQCGANGDVLGPASAYPPLHVNGDGTASATANLPIAMPTSGSYYINVHASADNMGTIIACGNLAPPIQ
jgi:hypothetical protein